MDTLSEKIVLLSALKDQVEFDSKFANICELVASMPDKSSPLETGLSSHMLKLLKQFAELHEYDNDSITFIFPTKSAIIKENIDEKSFGLLKDFLIEGQAAENARRIAPIIAAADFLQFRKLYTLLNVILITPLHINDDDNSIKSFMENHNIREDEDFNANGIDKAVKENHEYFELVANRFE